MPRFLLSLSLWLAAIGIAAAQTAMPPAASPERATATFAGGCFWCTESDFDKVEGVISTTSGYIGGRTANPTYHEVSAGGTGHAEAVEIVFDPKKVTFEKLLDVFWHSIDPLAKNRQFCDSGDQYRSAIFFHNEEQRRLAEATKKQVEARFKGQTVYTQIAAATTFTKAEDYHQDFHIKNSAKYKFYRWNCGRDQRLEQLWGKKGES
jgi:peptide-methionine (S)-S-oxide reductase